MLLFLCLLLLLPSPRGSLIVVGRLVLYGYQGANTDAEQLAFDQLFDAALGELSVVAL